MQLGGAHSRHNSYDISTRFTLPTPRTSQGFRQSTGTQNSTPLQKFTTIRPFDFNNPLGTPDNPTVESERINCLPAHLRKKDKYPLSSNDIKPLSPDGYRPATKILTSRSRTTLANLQDNIFDTGSYKAKKVIVKPVSLGNSKEKITMNHFLFESEMAQPTKSKKNLELHSVIDIPDCGKYSPLFALKCIESKRLLSNPSSLPGTTRNIDTPGTFSSRLSTPASTFFKTSLTVKDRKSSKDILKEIKKSGYLNYYNK